MRIVNSEAVNRVAEKALRMRINIIKMIWAAGSGHPGGSLSAADIVAVLYFWEMNFNRENFRRAERDRFVLSKGHAAPVLYAALAEAGFLAKEELLSLRKLGSRLQGHPDMNMLAGVEASTGSLGQGFSWAVGMALGVRQSKLNNRIYTLLGDGELEEGIVWEAAMAGGNFKLDNLTAIIDYNGLQIDGRLQEVMSAEPIVDKFAAFNWQVLEIDGHQPQQIMEALEQARGFKGRPTAIIAHTVKGRGCSFMENAVGWHGKAPSRAEAWRALCELDGSQGQAFKQFLKLDAGQEK